MTNHDGKGRRTAAWALAATTSAGLFASSAAAGARIALIGADPAQPGIAAELAAFNEAARAAHWSVSEYDSPREAASRLADAAVQKYDVVVVAADPAGLGSSLRQAREAGVAVVGMNVAPAPGFNALVANNNFAMAADSAAYLAARLDGKGAIVVFAFDAFPLVRARDAVAEAVFASEPGLKLLAHVTPNVVDGGLADSRTKMSELLQANPGRGAIAGVWAAWDAAGLGAWQAIEAAGRAREGIVVAAVDDNPPTRAAIAEGGGFEATAAPDYRAIGRATADMVKRILAGDKLKSRIVYVPSRLITAANANAGE